MQPGCHVVCIDDNFDHQSKRFAAKYGYRFPVKGTVYTVRAVHNLMTRPGTGYLLEEIVNPKSPLKINGSLVQMERRFRSERFRPLAKLKVEYFTGTLAPTNIDA